ncbi:MAG: hypothetical protein AB1730_26095, partial [Myxococcota bacterium]
QAAPAAYAPVATASSPPAVDAPASATSPGGAVHAPVATASSPHAVDVPASVTSPGRAVHAPVAPIAPAAQASLGPTSVAPVQAPVAAPATCVVGAAPGSSVRRAVATAASPAAAPGRARAAVLEVEDAAAAPSPPSPALADGIVRELRAALRGRSMSELASALGTSMDDTMRACAALMQQGQVVRRGLKYFVA